MGCGCVCLARFLADLDNFCGVGSIVGGFAGEAKELEEEVGAVFTVAIPGGGPRIPAPALCENLTYFGGYFQLCHGGWEAGRGRAMRGGRARE